MFPTFNSSFQNLFGCFCFVVIGDNMWELVMIFRGPIPKFVEFALSESTKWTDSWAQCNLM